MECLLQKLLHVHDARLVEVDCAAPVNARYYCEFFKRFSGCRVLDIDQGVYIPTWLGGADPQVSFLVMCKASHAQDALFGIALVDGSADRALHSFRFFFLGFFHYRIGQNHC